MKKLLTPKKVVLIVLLALVAGLLIFWLLNHNKNSNDPKQKMEKLVQVIGEFMLLPTDENPTLAEVSDITKLSRQPFFVRAENGDQVLIYSKNRLAILYRPRIKKIVNVGPIDGEVSFAKFSAAIRNGTTKTNLIETSAQVLSASFPNVSIIEKAAASRTNFPTTIVIPTSDEKKDLAAEVAAGIGAQVGVMPIGESVPNSEILIIIGKDFGKMQVQQ